MIENPLIVALDVGSTEEAASLASRLKDVAGGFKVGLELLMGQGPSVLRVIGEFGLPVFCDAKLHDIPTTVGRAASQLGRFGVRWVTVHASGGPDVLEAAAEGLADASAGRPAGILAVTVLTSLSGADLDKVGVVGTPTGQVTRLASMAAAHGAEGVVCSVEELDGVGNAAPGLLRATPGIRLEGSATDDQSRVATPADAARKGADLIIVGRPITRAADPVAVAKEVLLQASTARSR